LSQQSNLDSNAIYEIQNKYREDANRSRQYIKNNSSNATPVMQTQATPLVLERFDLSDMFSAAINNDYVEADTSTV
jgi:hypothetical protein